MVDESGIRGFFDSDDQLKSMGGHAALVLAMEAGGAGAMLLLSLVLEASVFAPGLMTFAGVLLGFAGGVTFYSPREFRSARAAFSGRDWRKLAFSVGDWVAPLVAGLFGVWLAAQIITFG